MDVVPELYRKELSVLQNGVPPKPPHEVHAMIAEQLGKSVGELFATFDDKPVGSASIGQVHRATLKDGRDVVVKVQYPEVRQLFESDFTQLVGACYFWRPEALNEMREFRRQFMCEFDFRREARVMRQIRSNLGSQFPNVVVPKPINELIADNVLVMTRLPGGSLLDSLTKMATAYAESQGITVEELKEKIRPYLLRRQKGDVLKGDDSLQPLEETIGRRLDRAGMTQLGKETQSVDISEDVNPLAVGMVHFGRRGGNRTVG